ncbi:MAG TPA: tripartite tricarboxylate transporter substrate-binding protein [Geminicoccus sp.]|uniref:tripartite tricarboxylate transporter substrate-binding protein n=1 Tax=Geminicoccus sp. TaxID=2024832 RepID=UPI002B9DBDF8|nr:tripartite tricarboxylate transporter substrate-binding protein [Geminicoccus sp.]HWL67645.1 tripartite tricarboxylate transporter substrate-binding protein [Geminicoccus sp.]
MRRGFIAAVIATALLGAGSAASAQEFPTKPVTIVVPFAAGGPTDTVTRLVAQSMTGTLGQQVIVENVGGAGGTLGAARVAKADPDGYTLLLHHIGQATSATLYRKLSYDPAKDFAPIGIVADVPMTVVARKDFPAADMKALIEQAKAEGDAITYANAGIGSASHLCGMLLMQALDVPLTTVAYKGTAPAMNDLLGGQVDLMCDQTTNTTSQIKGGTIKVYAVTTTERLPSLPDVPTTAESGLPDVQVGVWHGLYAPAGTDPAVVARLEEALQAAVTDPNVTQRLAELGATPATAETATPEALEQLVTSEIARWRPVIEAAGQYAD